MSVIWTTIAIIVLLLPGVSFFIGVATYERLSREIIRSGVVSELALAALIALALHTFGIIVMSAFGFRLSDFAIQFVADGKMSSPELIERIAARFLPATIYLMVLSVIGFGFGYLVAFGVLKGPLRFLAMHKWVYDVVAAGRNGGIVTAWVMTTTIEEKHVLMYRGRLHEIFLTSEGKISYVVLRNCAKFYMTFSETALESSSERKIFEGSEDGRKWDYLVIDGTNIANILFDPSPEKIRETNEGTKALQTELERSRAVARERLMEFKRRIEQGRRMPGSR